MPHFTSFPYFASDAFCFGFRALPNCRLSRDNHSLRTPIREIKVQTDLLNRWTIDKFLSIISYSGRLFLFQCRKCVGGKSRVLLTLASQKYNLIFDIEVNSCAKPITLNLLFHIGRCSSPHPQFLFINSSFVHVFMGITQERQY